jgi:hypothetical protein
MEGNIKKSFRVQGKHKWSSQIRKFIVKQSRNPESGTLDYNCQRSESGEHKLILQFRKFTEKQTGTIWYPEFQILHYNCRSSESKHAHANTIICRQGLQSRKLHHLWKTRILSLRLIQIKMGKELNSAVGRNVECIRHLKDSFTKFTNSSVRQYLCKTKVHLLQNGWMHINLMYMHLPMVHIPKTSKRKEEKTVVA